MYKLWRFLLTTLSFIYPFTSTLRFLSPSCSFPPCCLRLCNQFLLCRPFVHLYRPCFANIFLVRGDLSANQNYYLNCISILELEKAELSFGIWFLVCICFFFEFCCLMFYLFIFRSTTWVVGLARCKMYKYLNIHTTYILSRKVIICPLSVSQSLTIYIYFYGLSRYRLRMSITNQRLFRLLVAVKLKTKYRICVWSRMLEKPHLHFSVKNLEIITRI
jgi:hypothetical protein